jgi:hypothetical protein
MDRECVFVLAFANAVAFVSRKAEFIIRAVSELGRQETFGRSRVANESIISAYPIARDLAPTHRAREAMGAIERPVASEADEEVTLRL